MFDMTVNQMAREAMIKDDFVTLESFKSETDLSTSSTTLSPNLRAHTSSFLQG